MSTPKTETKDPSGEGSASKEGQSVDPAAGTSKSAASPSGGTQALATAFGWISGACLGLLINYGLFLAIGPSYPEIPTTFVFIVVGCFAGMRLSDQLGPKAFRVMGITAGILLATTVALGSVIFWSAAGP